GQQVRSERAWSFLERRGVHDLDVLLAAVQQQEGRPADEADLRGLGGPRPRDPLRDPGHAVALRRPPLSASDEWDSGDRLWGLKSRPVFERAKAEGLQELLRRPVQ